MRKIITKTGLFLAAVLLVGNVSAQTIGSMMGNDLPLYPIRDGSAPGVAIAGTTFDYKAVTIGTKTWAWTNLKGKNIAGNLWSSQFRFWAGGKLENNLTGRVAGSQQTFGTFGIPSANPSTITFVQEENNNFFETADITYDYTQVNSANAADVTAPALADPNVTNQTSLQVSFTLSATDESGNFFYLIEDADNNFTEVSFVNETTLAIEAGVDYNFSVTAIDFSGNRSDAKIVPIDGGEPAYLTEGIARDLSFKLDSRSLTELVIEATSTAAMGFGDAYAKVSINGAWIMNGTAAKEWKPVGLNQTTGTPVYQMRIPASDIPGWEEGKVLTLDLGYIIAPVGGWGHYVSPNLVITAGENTGAPLLHQIGTGTDIGELEPPKTYECDGNNILSDVSFELGNVYFAPNWNLSTNYDASWAEGELTLRLGAETFENWQVQIPLLCDMQTLVAQTTYFLSFDITTSVDLARVYMKVQRNGDDYNDFYLEIPALNLSAGTHTVSGIYKNTGSTTITQFDRILFDFGDNPPADITISNIHICDGYKEAGEGTAINIPVITSELIKTQYFTVDGRQVANPTFGIYIVRKIYKDNSVQVEKVIIK